MNVRVHIDRLVLDGLDLPPGSGVALGVALERELARRIAGGGLAPSLLGGIAVPSLGTPPINAAGPPRQLGAAVGGALYGAIGNSTARGGR
jgi:hypothetical protein